MYRDVIRYQPDLVLINGSLNWGEECKDSEDYRKVLTQVVKVIKAETKVTNFRLTEAKDLLLNTRESIEHIAELVGYNSGDHFSYMFRKTYGISPMRYRQRDVNGDGAFQKTHLPIP